MTGIASIGPLRLGGAPLVVGVIGQPHTLDQPLSGDPACDVVEFRIDLFGVDHVGWMARALEFEAAGIPVIATCRHRGEGGHWYRDEDERFAVYQAVVPYVAAVDVEIRSGIFSAVANLAREKGRCLLGSFHDFEATPPADELSAVVEEGLRGGAAVVKLATQLKAQGDPSVLEEVLRRHAGSQLAVMGMGPGAAEARVALACAGSCLVYGFLDEAVAPGQVSVEEVRRRLAQSLPGYKPPRSGRGS